MNQEKTGKFISTCRKDKGLTQMQLAEMLEVTNRAVSKWETGKSCPDVSIMLELCGILGITVNELLSGERIVMEDYRKKAEKNLIELQSKKEKAQKTLLKAKFVWLAMAVLLIPVWFTIHSFFPEKYINGAGFFVLAVGLVTAAVYSVSAGHEVLEMKGRYMVKKAIFMALFVAALYFVYYWCTRYGLHRWDAYSGTNVGYTKLFGLQALLTFAAAKAFLSDWPDRDFALGINAAACSVFMIMVFQIEILFSMTREASLAFFSSVMREIFNPGMFLLHIAYGALINIGFKDIAAWWPQDMRAKLETA